MPEPPQQVMGYNRPAVHTIWRGPSVLTVDPRGRAGGHDLTGFFFREARHLRELRLEIEGEEPFPCSLAETAPNALEVSFIYPPVEGGGGGGSGSGGSGEKHGLLFRSLDLDLRYRLRAASLEAVLRVTSRWADTPEFELGWAVGADFAGLSDAALGRGGPGSSIEQADADEMGAALRFRGGRQGLELLTDVRVEGAGRWAHEGGGRLVGRLALQRQRTAEIRLTVRAVDPADPLDDAAEERREEQLRSWRRTVVRLHAPAETPLASMAETAMHELGSLALLEGEEDEWLTPTAGMPLYPATFGRDALTAGWQAGVFDRGDLVRSTLTRLRRIQGTDEDPWRDERPGRIVQQARSGPSARLGETPFARYYGDFASPLMFIIGLGQLYAWSGERRDVQANWDAARRILDWTREHGDRDGDGYLEYQTLSEQGPKHQGWKDSDNAVVDDEGRQVEAPIAPCEIQGYYHAALQFMAVLSIVMDEEDTALDLWEEAKALKERFNRDFWLDEEGYIALGLGPDKQPIRSLTSNAAQCITTGIVDEAKLPRLVRRSFEPDLFSGWGLRTLSTGNPSYNPLSYHLGSVWAVENGTILFGLRRYGFDDRALQLAQGLYDLARLWPGGRIPECVGGYARTERAHPGAYPRANAPQAWNRSTFAILVQTLLGMRAVAALDVLAVDPVLPPWLPEVTVKDLRVGASTVTLHFRRDTDGRSDYDVVRKDGPLRVVRQPPVDSLTAGLWDRLGALAKDVLPW